MRNAPTLAREAAEKLLAEIDTWPIRAKPLGREWVTALVSGDQRGIDTTSYRLIPILRNTRDEAARATVVAISERHQAARAPYNLAQMLRRTFPDHLGDITGEEVVELGITGYEPATAVADLASRVAGRRATRLSQGVLDLAGGDTRA